MLYSYIGEDIFYKLFNGGILAKALIALKLPIVAVSFFAMITLNYYILPLVRVPIRAILPGAVFSSFGLFDCDHDICKLHQLLGKLRHSVRCIRVDCRSDAVVLYNFVDTVRRDDVQ